MNSKLISVMGCLESALLVMMAVLIVALLVTV